MNTGSRKALNVLGEHDKATTTGATDRARLGKLRDYLRGLHSLDFTEKGRANVCRRFYVSDDELSTAISALQSPRPNTPTPALLHTIGAAIGHHTTGKEAALW